MPASLGDQIPYAISGASKGVLQGAVWSCVLNETALVAATASADFSAKVWNALTGDETHSFKHGHICRTLAFATATPRLLTAGQSCHSVTF